MNSPIPGTKIQGLMFPKALYTPARAASWALRNGFEGSAPDVGSATATMIRVRAKGATRFVKGSFKTVPISDGVKAVVGVPVAKRNPFRSRISHTSQEATMAGRPKSRARRAARQNPHRFGVGDEVRVYSIGYGTTFPGVVTDLLGDGMYSVRTEPRPGDNGKRYVGTYFAKDVVPPRVANPKRKNPHPPAKSYSIRPSRHQEARVSYERRPAKESAHARATRIAEEVAREYHLRGESLNHPGLPGGIAQIARVGDARAAAALAAAIRKQAKANPRRNPEWAHVKTFTRPGMAPRVYNALDVDDAVRIVKKELMAGDHLHQVSIRPLVGHGIGDGFDVNVSYSASLMGPRHMKSFTFLPIG